jgi:hypothetical protein
MRAIIKANKPMASVKAKPKIAILNNSLLREGFLEMALIREANMRPTPIAAPARAIVAKPAPINLAKMIMRREDYLESRSLREEGEPIKRSNIESIRGGLLLAAPPTALHSSQL